MENAHDYTVFRSGGRRGRLGAGWLCKQLWRRGRGGTGAVIGAAAGAAVGSLVKKDGRCYRVNRNGTQYEVRC